MTKLNMFYLKNQGSFSLYDAQNYGISGNLLINFETISYALELIKFQKSCSFSLASELFTLAVEISHSILNP